MDQSTKLETEENVEPEKPLFVWYKTNKQTNTKRS